MNENIFYTYIYLDPRKLGLYQYGNYTFEYEPFYVGKGKGNRLNEHLYIVKKENCKSENNYRDYKIRNILDENFKPIILKVEENLFEQEALNLEIWLIWAIGRANLHTGILTNLTDGGDGVSGRIISERERQRMIDWGKNNSLGEKNGMFGKTHSSETKMKISEKLRVVMKGKLTGEKNGMFGKTLSAEARKKIGDSFRGKTSHMKGKSYDEIHGKEKAEYLRESHSRRMTGSENPIFGIQRSEETREKIGKKNKGKIRTKEVREEMSKVRKGKPSGNKGKKFKWSDEDRIRLYADRFKKKKVDK